MLMRHCKRAMLIFKVYMQVRADERIGNETLQERDTMKLATMQGHCRQEICTHACICKCSVIMGGVYDGKNTPFNFYPIPIFLGYRQKQNMKFKI